MMRIKIKEKLDRLFNSDLKRIAFLFATFTTIECVIIPGEYLIYFIVLTELFVLAYIYKNYSAEVRI